MNHSLTHSSLTHSPTYHTHPHIHSDTHTAAFDGPAEHRACAGTAAFSGPAPIRAQKYGVAAARLAYFNIGTNTLPRARQNSNVAAQATAVFQAWNKHPPPRARQYSNVGISTPSRARQYTTFGINTPPSVR